MPLNDKTIENLKRAISALNTQPATAGAWEAFAPLSQLASSGHRLTIDLRASDKIGAPVILAQPGSRTADLLRPLTPRQQQVAQAIFAGRSNKQIASELGISLGTVKDHVHAVLERLQLRSRAELIAAMARAG